MSDDKHYRPITLKILREAQNIYSDECDPTETECETGALELFVLSRLSDEGFYHYAIKHTDSIYDQYVNLMDIEQFDRQPFNFNRFVDQYLKADQFNKLSNKEKVDLFYTVATFDPDREGQEITQLHASINGIGIEYHLEHLKGIHKEFSKYKNVIRLTDDASLNRILLDLEVSDQSSDEVNLHGYYLKIVTLIGCAAHRMNNILELNTVCCEHNLQEAYISLSKDNPLSSITQYARAHLYTQMLALPENRLTTFLDALSIDKSAVLDSILSNSEQYEITQNATIKIVADNTCFDAFELIDPVIDESVEAYKAAIKGQSPATLDRLVRIDKLFVVMLTLPPFR